MRGESVLIFKAVSDDLGDKDPYVRVLADKGYSVQTVPVLEFKFRNLIPFKEKLDCPERYGGMILSNPRCVQAVAEAAEELGEGWRNLPVYCVGETTARQAEEMLGVRTTAATNAGALITIIVKERSLRPLLLPSGNASLDTMERLLSRQGVVTDLVEVYTTVPSPVLEACTSAALEAGLPRYVAYFSPSGVHASYPVLKEALDVDQTKWISIGPTTGAALESYGLAVAAAAKIPTPEALAEAVVSCGPRLSGNVL